MNKPIAHPWNQYLWILILIAGLIALPVGANAHNSQPSEAASAAVQNPDNPVTPTMHATGVSAGTHHTCALTDNGGVKCWGRNTYGQLGDDTTTDRLTPVDVVGLSSGVVSVSAGNHHTCALLNTGAVKCWGRNNFGRLGDGTTIDRHTPVDVVGLPSDVSNVVTGFRHTCALLDTGGVMCWGANESGQLGDNTNNTSLVPIYVYHLTHGAISVSAGSYHSCAVTNRDELKCWGANYSGQLGNGTTTDSNIPITINGFADQVMQVSAGEDHTCARTASLVYCWGENEAGQLGDGTTLDRLTPIYVPDLVGVAAAISAGLHQTCALTITGGAKCWGGNEFGQLGTGTTTDSTIPADVVGLASGVTAISAGDYHSCADASGQVLCWGDNQYGQLGTGVPGKRVAPVEVLGIVSGASAVSAGGRHTCALAAGGELCWGRNTYGQLGDGTEIDRLLPVNVTGLLSQPIGISAGPYHSCALLVGGGVDCWGANWYGQLGDNTTTNRQLPTPVIGFESNGAAQVVTGGRHSCALTTAGGVKCWGANGSGQLGDGTVSDHLAPVGVFQMSRRMLAVSAGNYHTCALTNLGGVKCWGDNQYGQLGNSSMQGSLIPVDVPDLTSGVIEISAGNFHTCARTTSGGLKCWGANSDGQLGNGTIVDSPTPTDVIGLTSGVITMSSGYEHTCAIANDGVVLCWGRNTFGQLGNGMYDEDQTPVPVGVVGITGSASQVSAGNYHTCAIVAGDVLCWGRNTYGQLGNGEVGHSPTPVEPDWVPPVFLPLILRP